MARLAACINAAVVAVLGPAQDDLQAVEAEIASIAVADIMQTNDVTVCFSAAPLCNDACLRACRTLACWPRHALRISCWRFRAASS